MAGRRCRMKWPHVALTVLLVAGLAGTSSVYFLGSRLIEPRLQSVGKPPAALRSKAVVIERAGRPSIAGWYGGSGDAKSAVLLLHSVRANRREMIERAEFLVVAGYAVLLVDLQAHGETTGEHIGFGYTESRDVVDAVAFLRTRHESVGVIGASMGGAAAILASKDLNVEALVAEAVFNDISTAVENRLRIYLGSLGPYMAPLLLWQLEPRTGISVEAISPARAVRDLGAPLLVIAGESDERTTLPDSRELFDNAGQPKSLWVVPGARHQDFHELLGTEYENRVLQFFDRHLRVKAT